MPLRTSCYYRCWFSFFSSSLLMLWCAKPLMGCCALNLCSKFWSPSLDLLRRGLIRCQRRSAKFTIHGVLFLVLFLLRPDYDFHSHPLLDLVLCYGRVIFEASPDFSHLYFFKFCRVTWMKIGGGFLPCSGSGIGGVFLNEWRQRRWYWWWLGLWVGGGWWLVAGWMI